MVSVLSLKLSNNGRPVPVQLKVEQCNLWKTKCAQNPKKSQHQKSRSQPVELPQHEICGNVEIIDGEMTANKNI